MKYRLLTTAAAIMVGSAAFAGSYSPPPAPPQVYYEPPETGTDWSGFYVGVLGGVQNGDLEINSSGILDPFDAMTYGVLGGYNYQMGDFVLGAELDAQMGSGTLATVGGMLPAQDFNFDYLVDARARVGYALDMVLVYAAGGYTMGSITDTTPATDTVAGWNAGAGLELALSDKFFVGGEYIYRSLSSDGVNIFGAPFTTKSHGFQARAGLRF